MKLIVSFSTLATVAAFGGIGAWEHEAWGSCQWFRNNYNTAEEWEIGSDVTPVECISLALDSEYGCDIANIGDEGDCWCQKGDDTRHDEGAGYMNCLLRSLGR